MNPPTSPPGMVFQVNRGWIFAGIVVAILAAPAVFVKIRGARQTVVYEEELRLARQEGLITNAAEYKATIPPVPVAENAAQFYIRMDEIPGRGDNFSGLHHRILRTPDPLALREARVYLAQKKNLLDLADQAAKLPRCWFDRDWSQGAAVSLEELADLKRGARAIALRGSVAAAEGRTDAAIQDAQRLFTIARHAGEEGHLISRMVMESIYELGIRHLAYSASMHRDEPAYRKALADAIAAYPSPDYRREYSDELYQVLLVLDDLGTVAGRRRVGLPEESRSFWQRFSSPSPDRADAKLKIVKAEREFWAAIGGPTPDPAKAVEARLTRTRVFSNVPVLQAIFSRENDTVALRIHRGSSRRMKWIALNRALAGSAIPRSIKTDDLSSPYDKRPLTYRFDGKQVEIDVSAPPGVEPEPLVFSVREGKYLAPRKFATQ